MDKGINVRILIEILSLEIFNIFEIRTSGVCFTCRNLRKRLLVELHNYTLHVH